MHQFLYMYANFVQIKRNFQLIKLNYFLFFISIVQLSVATGNYKNQRTLILLYTMLGKLDSGTCKAESKVGSPTEKSKVLN